MHGELLRLGMSPRPLQPRGQRLGRLALDVLQLVGGWRASPRWFPHLPYVPLEAVVPNEGPADASLYSAHVRICAPHAFVAEDDPWMRSLVVEALRKDGWIVHESASAPELLENLRTATRATLDKCTVLVLSDIRMPGMSGLELAARLRSERLTVTVVLMTAFGDGLVHEQAQAMGVRLFDKPFKMSALRALARELLEASKAAP